MYRTGLAGYDETGQATLERLTELSVMRSKVKEAYGAKSPQYIAISKKCQIEMTALKEREVRKKAEYKREQEMMAAAEQAAAAPESSIGAQIKANAEAMSQDFAASQSEETGGGTGEASMLDGEIEMNESALAAMGEIAAGMSPEPESRPLPSEPKNEYMLMVTANEFVAHPKKLRIVASSLDELCDAVAEQLGLAEPVFVCAPSDDVGEAVPYASHDDLGAKAKVSVWPARCFGMDDGDDDDEDLAAMMQGFEAEDAETEPTAQEAEEAEVGVPPVSAEPAAASRDFLLMVTANDAVLNAKKLKITAVDIDELFDKVAEGLGLNEPVFVCPVAASVGEALPYDSLDAIGDKAKVSVWPVRCFEEAEAAEALPEGSPPDDAKAGGEFGYDDEDAAFNAMMMEEAREAEEEEARMAAEVGAANAREETRRAEAAARAEEEEEARAAAAAKAEEEGRAAAAAKAAWEAREAEQQAAATAAAAAAAVAEAAAAAEAEAAAAASAEAEASAAAAVAAAASAAEEEEVVEAGEPDLAVARKFILMVVANDVIKPARLLRVEACSLGELRRKVSEGLDLGTNPVEVCPVAASVEAAVPYATLAEIKDKAKVSVWPCSSFGSGATLAPLARPPAPAPAAVDGGEVSAREKARQKALERNAAASPDARAAARERAKARLAAQQAS